MKYVYLIALSVLFSNVLCAQDTQIKGRVVDAESGMPLSNASVKTSDSKGTTTDRNGNFSLNCSGTLEITVSFVGYETIRQKVACGQTVEIALLPVSTNLQEIEVTATSNPNKDLLYQPASISKIGVEEINRGTGLSLDDAINTNIPGVYMERRTFSAGQQFNIRGYGNGTRGTNGINSNFDGQGYKVYLNGIPITDAEGITLMDDIDFGSIGNVEVVKGPAGALYGQAIAGVVNLITKKPQPGSSSIGQEVLFGSYGLQRYTTTLQLGKEKSSVLVNYGKQKFDGFMPHTNSDKDFINLFGEFAPNLKQTISTYFGYSEGYDNRNGEISKADWETRNYAGNPRYLKNDAHSNVRTIRAGLSHTYNFTTNFYNTTSLFGTGLISDVSSAAGWTDKSAFNYGIRSVIGTKFPMEGGFQLSGITGIETQKQNAQTLGYAMVADSFNLPGYNIIGAIRSDQYTVTKTTSLFTEWTLTMPHALSVTAGLGYSTLGIELNNRLYTSSNNNPSNPNANRLPTRFENTFNDMVSPHLAINKVFSDEISIYASFSTGFKAPVSSYFFIPTTGEVLKSLKPERGIQYEAGTKGNLFDNRLNYQFAAYYITYKDKMTTVAVPDATNTATSYVYVVNGGRQNNFGIELSVKGIAYESGGFLKQIHPFANITFAHYRYGDFRYQQLSADKKSVVITDYTDNVVAGVPPVTFNAGIDLTSKPGLYMNMTYSLRDKMYYTSDNLNQTGKNQLLNAKFGFAKTFAKHFATDIFFGLNNITGHQNYFMVFLNQLPDAYLPAPDEINYFGGVQLKYIL